MKSHLKVCTLLFLVMAVLLLSACEGKKTGEPQLKITADNKKIQVIYYGNQYNKTREELEKRLKMAMEGKSLEDIPYIALNGKIIIEAENFKTEELTVSDYILRSDGTFRYGDRATNTSVVPVKKGRAALSLSANPAASLSSNSSDYLPGKTVRGFIIQTDIEGSSFTFAFILRTDAR
jgi:hypothetical protein